MLHCVCEKKLNAIALHACQRFFVFCFLFLPFCFIYTHTHLRSHITSINVYISSVWFLDIAWKHTEQMIELNTFWHGLRTTCLFSVFFLSFERVHLLFFVTDRVHFQVLRIGNYNLKTGIPMQILNFYTFEFFLEGQPSQQSIFSKNCLHSESIQFDDRFKSSFLILNRFR